ELPPDADCIGLLNMDKVKIDPTYALRVPAALALRRQVLPFAFADGCVHVACANVLDVAALQAIEKLVAAPGRPEPAGHDALLRGRDRVYGDLQAAAGATGGKPRLLELRPGAEPQADDVVTLCDETLHAAILRQASDIHIDPEADGVQIRFRIDG